MVNDQKGACLAMQHLIKREHRAIAFLAGPEVSYSGRQRLSAYRSAMAQAELPMQPTWVRHCGPTVEAGREAAKALLQEHPKITAMFCYNDLIAVGALQTCMVTGCRVPDDVAIVGYDDIPLATLVTPSLTTCHIPRYELGSRAIRLLLDQINGHRASTENPVIEPHLIVRESAP